MGTIRRTEVLKIAKKYADEGYHEEGNNRTIFGELCDSVNYFAPQGSKNGQPWCHMFINAIFMMASDSSDDESKKFDAQNYLGEQPSYNNLSAGCTFGADYFRDIGHFYDPGESYIGDIIYFGERYHESHVGIICDIDYDSSGDVETLYTIEGNKSDAVRYGTYSVNDPNISGVGKATYSDYYDDLDENPEPSISSYNCVDVSEYNGEIDWEQAKADGVDYAFIRCGLGRYYLFEADEEKRAEKQAKWEETQGEDKYFQINMENAINAGVKIGVYFYSYATDWDSSVDEANICMRIIDKYADKITFPVFYDVEEQVNVPRITDVVMGFVNTLNYDNYNVGAYTSGDWYSSYFRNIDVDYIWLAYWGADDGEPHNKPDYCDIWQYSSKGSVNGIGNSDVDVDILYNTDMKLLIHEPDPKPEPTPDPPTKKVTIELEVLSRGDTGGQVNTLKALLNEFGFSDELPLDGDFDYDTEVAVNHYKENYGLEPDGIVDEDTWKLLLL